jgi:hypothetical protein
MKNLKSRAVWFAMFLLVASHTSAGEGVTVVRDRCYMRMGVYLMNYSVYQPDMLSRGPFCADLPAAARTLIVLDVEQDSGGMSFVSDHYNELRDMAIDLRILRNVGQGEDDENLEQNTEAYLPPREYPLGTVQLEHTFTRNGSYIGLVSARDGHGRVFVSRIPFTVGPRFNVWPYAAGGLVLPAAAGWILARRWSRRRPRLYSIKNFIFSASRRQEE